MANYFCKHFFTIQVGTALKLGSSAKVGPLLYTLPVFVHDIFIYYFFSFPVPLKIIIDVECDF
jgi:hypothetical protein